MAKQNEITVVEKKINPLVSQAEQHQITDDRSLAGAVTLLSKMNTANDMITAEKEKVTKPLLQALNAERKRWKPMETLFENAIMSLRRRMTDYQTAAVKKADDEAKRIASRVAPGKGNLSAETAIRKMSEIDEPERAVATDAGLVKFRTVKKFEVMDVTMLPVEYIEPNMAAIRVAMKEGKELPGIRYYEEQEPVNFR